MILGHAFAGIAIYDEYPDMYNHVIKMMFKDYLPVRNYIYPDITIIRERAT